MADGSDGLGACWMRAHNHAQREVLNNFEYHDKRSDKRQPVQTGVKHDHCTKQRNVHCNLYKLADEKFIGLPPGFRALLNKRKAKKVR